MKNHINFIISNWGNAHQLNRVLGFETLGYTTKLFVYIRNIYPSGVNRKNIILGEVNPGVFNNRLLTYIKVFFKLWKHIKSNETFFIFGLDNLIMITLISKLTLRRVKIIFEVADIRDFQLKKGWKGKLIRNVEKWTFTHIDLLIVTSEEFVTGFYQKYNYPFVRHHLFENKIHENIKDKTKNDNFKPLSSLNIETNNKLIIGFFGMIRDPQSLKILIELSRKGDILVILRGVFMDNSKHFQELIEKEKNIVYLGPYVSPIDLSNMYKELDLAWIAYPYRNSKEGNWQWARTNRYYEAGQYKKPMLGSMGTQDGKNITRLRIGLEIDLSDIQEAVKTVLSITKEDIQNWEEKLHEVPSSFFEVTDEYNKLAAVVASL